MGRLLSKEIKEEWRYNLLTATFLTCELPKIMKLHFWTIFEQHMQLDYKVQNSSLYKLWNWLGDQNICFNNFCCIILHR